MHFHSLTLMLVSASLATAELEKRQNGYDDSYYSSLEAELSSLENTDYMGYLTDYSDYPEFTDYPSFTYPSFTDLPQTTDLHAGGSSGGNGGNGDNGGNGGSGGVTAAPTMPSIPPMPSNTMDSIPASIESVLITAIPSSYLSELANPTAASSLISEIQHGDVPTWYQELPGSVKSWLSDHYATAKAGSSGSGGNGGNSAPATGVAATGLLSAMFILAVAVLL